jgi:hypothetical protein
MERNLIDTVDALLASHDDAELLATMVIRRRKMIHDNAKRLQPKLGLEFSEEQWKSLTTFMSRPIEKDEQGQGGLDGLTVTVKDACWRRTRTTCCLRWSETGVRRIICSLTSGRSKPAFLPSKDLSCTSSSRTAVSSSTFQSAGVILPGPAVYVSDTRLSGF